MAEKQPAQGSPSTPDMISPEEIQRMTPAQQREVATTLLETAVFISEINEEHIKKLQSIPWEKLQQPSDPNRPLTDEDKDAWRKLWDLIESGKVSMAEVLGYNEDELYRIYSTGMGFANQGRYDDALKLAEGLLTLVPNFIPALLLKAEALRKTERIDEALAAYNAAVSADPMFIQSYFERAKLFFAVDNTQMFLMDIETIANLDPEARTLQGKRARLILEATEKALLEEGLTPSQVAEAEKALLSHMVDRPADQVPEIDEDGNQILKK